MMRRFAEGAFRIFLACDYTDFQKQISSLVVTVTLTKISVKQYNRTARQPDVRAEMLAGLPEEIEEYIFCRKKEQHLWRENKSDREVCGPYRSRIPPGRSCCKTDCTADSEMCGLWRKGKSKCKEPFPKSYNICIPFSPFNCDPITVSIFSLKLKTRLKISRMKRKNRSVRMHHSRSLKTFGCR